MRDYRTLVVLQPTTFCNINCQYCYLPDQARSTRMSREIVRQVAEKVFSSDLVEEPFVFLWHLGEPLAVPPAYYEEAFAAIASINQTYKRQYVLSLQTNATLLNERWIRLSRDHQIKLGISLDDPAFLHDRQRVTRSGPARGTPASGTPRPLQCYLRPDRLFSRLSG